MQIWVDADACPGVIRDILFRAAERVQMPMTLVANHLIPVPPSRWIKARQVSSGFDVADDEIVRLMEAGDIVITADIPLAAEVIAKGGHALSPRGELFTKDNVRARLSMRDFLDTMRASGINTGGPPALNAQDRKAFADQLDRLLAASSR